MLAPQKIKWRPLILAILAVMLAFFGQYQFANSEEPPLLAVLAFFLAAVCLFTADRRMTSPPQNPPSDPDDTVPATMAEQEGITTAALPASPPDPPSDPGTATLAAASAVVVDPDSGVAQDTPPRTFAQSSAAPPDAVSDTPLADVVPRYAPILLMASLALGVGTQALIAAEHIALGVLGYTVAVGGAMMGTMPVSRSGPLSAQPASYTRYDWQPVLAFAAVAASASTFALSGDNRYRFGGVALWITSIVCWWAAWGNLTRPTWPAWSLPKLRSQWSLIALVAGVLLVGAAYRFVNLDINPLEMGSDHAEKLLDVHDVLNGTPYIFFERNTGREPWQFYWTVILVQLLNIPPDFMALKIGTSLIGWLMLPAIFLLAREVFGTRTALVATLFAAVASWAVIPARFGLRYPLAPCATAWTFYFLVRGLRRNERNAMLAMGVWMGIGLQGYTAYRFMPVVVALIVVLVLIGHSVRRRRAVAIQTFVNSSLAFVMVMLLLMPLIRYGFDRPEVLLYRMTSRITEQERAIEGDVGGILLSNLRNVLLFFNHTYDVVPVVNIPNTPAMDTVLGAALVIGAAAAATLSFKARDMWPAAVLGAGLLMLFPSALSIAYPGENPSIVRTGGAIPMLMIVCAIIPGMLLEHARRYDQVALRVVSIASVVVLSTAVIALNTDRVFRQYPAQYCSVGRNASDIARELEAFVAAGNARANAGWSAIRIGSITALSLSGSVTSPTATRSLGSKRRSRSI